MPDIVVRKKRRTGTVGTASVAGAPVVTLKSSTPGPIGPQGETGVAGLPGVNGYDGGTSFVFNTITTDTDPGYGRFSYNSATIANVTYIYVDIADAFMNNVEALIQTWDDSTSTIRGHLVIKKNGTGELNVFAVTGNVINGTGYWKIPVQYITGALYTTMDLCMVQFSRTGDAGQTLAFQTAVADSLGDYDIDCTTYKDWICTVTGDCTINLNNTADGDAGMLELIIELDSSEATCAVTLGTMWTKQMGPTVVDETDGADNIISWRKVGTSNIVYTIAQIEV